MNKMRTLPQAQDTAEKMDMIVKRVSVPIGLEEVMEGLCKEVLLKKPKDLYIFASEYFAKLVNLREKDHKYKTHPQTLQSAATIKNPNSQVSKKILPARPTKHLSRQLSVRNKSSDAANLARTKAIEKRINASKSRERSSNADRKDIAPKVISKTTTPRDLSKTSNKTSGTSTGTSSVQSTPREKRQSSVPKREYIDDEHKKVPRMQKKSKSDKIKTALVSPTVIGGSAAAAGIPAKPLTEIIKDTKTSHVFDSDILAKSTNIAIMNPKANINKLTKSDTVKTENVDATKRDKESTGDKLVVGIQSDLDISSNIFQNNTFPTLRKNESELLRETTTCTSKENKDNIIQEERPVSLIDSDTNKVIVSENANVENTKDFQPEVGNKIIRDVEEKTELLRETTTCTSKENTDNIIQEEDPNSSIDSGTNKVIVSENANVENTKEFLPEVGNKIIRDVEEKSYSMSSDEFPKSSVNENKVNGSKPDKEIASDSLNKKTKNDDTKNQNVDLSGNSEFSEETNLLKVGRTLTEAGSDLPSADLINQDLENIEIPEVQRNTQSQNKTGEERDNTTGNCETDLCKNEKDKHFNNQPTTLSSDEKQDTISKNIIEDPSPKEKTQKNAFLQTDQNVNDKAGSKVAVADTEHLPTLKNSLLQSIFEKNTFNIKMENSGNSDDVLTVSISDGSEEKNNLNENKNAAISESSSVKNTKQEKIQFFREDETMASTENGQAKVIIKNEMLIGSSDKTKKSSLKETLPTTDKELINSSAPVIKEQTKTIEKISAKPSEKVMVVSAQNAGTYISGEKTVSSPLENINLANEKESDDSSVEVENKQKIQVENISVKSPQKDLKLVANASSERKENPSVEVDSSTSVEQEQTNHIDNLSAKSPEKNLKNKVVNANDEQRENSDKKSVDSSAQVKKEQTYYRDNIILKSPENKLAVLPQNYETKIEDKNEVLNASGEQTENQHLKDTNFATNNKFVESSAQVEKEQTDHHEKELTVSPQNCETVVKPKNEVVNASSEQTQNPSLEDISFAIDNKFVDSSPQVEKEQTPNIENMIVKSPVANASEEQTENPSLEDTNFVTDNKSVDSSAQVEKGQTHTIENMIVKSPVVSASEEQTENPSLEDTNFVTDNKFVDSSAPVEKEQTQNIENMIVKSPVANASEEQTENPSLKDTNFVTDNKSVDSSAQMEKAQTHNIENMIVKSPVVSASEEQTENSFLEDTNYVTDNKSVDSSAQMEKEQTHNIENMIVKSPVVSASEEQTENPSLEDTNFVTDNKSVDSSDQVEKEQTHNIENMIVKSPVANASEEQTENPSLEDTNFVTDNKSVDSSAQVEKGQTHNIENMIVKSPVANASEEQTENPSLEDTNFITDNKSVVSSTQVKKAQTHYTDNMVVKSPEKDLRILPGDKAENTTLKNSNPNTEIKFVDSSAQIKQQPNHVEGITVKSTEKDLTVPTQNVETKLQLLNEVTNMSDEKTKNSYLKESYLPSNKKSVDNNTQAAKEHTNQAENMSIQSSDNDLIVLPPNDDSEIEKPPIEETKSANKNKSVDSTDLLKKEKTKSIDNISAKSLEKDSTFITQNDNTELKNGVDDVNGKNTENLFLKDTNRATDNTTVDSSAPLTKQSESKTDSESKDIFSHSNKVTETDRTKNIIDSNISSSQPGLIDLPIKNFLHSFINTEQLNVFKNDKSNEQTKSKTELNRNILDNEEYKSKEGNLTFNSVKDLLDFDYNTNQTAKSDTVDENNKINHDSKKTKRSIEDNECLKDIEVSNQRDSSKENNLKDKSNKQAVQEKTDIKMHVEHQLLKEENLTNTNVLERKDVPKYDIQLVEPTKNIVTEEKPLINEQGNDNLNLGASTDQDLKREQVDPLVSKFLNSFLVNEQSNVFKPVDLVKKSDGMVISNKTDVTKKVGKQISYNSYNSEKITRKTIRSLSHENVLSNGKLPLSSSAKRTKNRRPSSVGVRPEEIISKSKIPTPVRKSAGRRPLVRQLETDSRDMEEKMEIPKEFSGEKETSKKINKELHESKDKMEDNPSKDKLTKEDVLIAKTILKGIEGAEKHIELIEEKYTNKKEDMSKHLTSSVGRKETTHNYNNTYEQRTISKENMDVPSNPTSNKDGPQITLKPNEVSESVEKEILDLTTNAACDDNSTNIIKNVYKEDIYDRENVIEDNIPLEANKEHEAKPSTAKTKDLSFKVTEDITNHKIKELNTHTHDNTIPDNNNKNMVLTKDVTNKIEREEKYSRSSQPTNVLEPAANEINDIIEKKLDIKEDKNNNKSESQESTDKTACIKETINDSSGPNIELSIENISRNVGNLSSGPSTPTNKSKTNGSIQLKESDITDNHRTDTLNDNSSKSMSMINEKENTKEENPNKIKLNNSETKENIDIKDEIKQDIKASDTNFIISNNTKDLDLSYEEKNQPVDTNSEKNEDFKTNQLNIAATKIQKTWKGYNTKTKYKNTYKDCDVLGPNQENLTSSIGPTELHADDLKAKDAAVKIQSIWRGFVTRKMLSSLGTKATNTKIDREKSIIKIQAVVRGYLDRLKYENLKNINKKKENPAENILSEINFTSHDNKKDFETLKDTLMYDNKKEDTREINDKNKNTVVDGEILNKKINKETENTQDEKSLAEIKSNTNLVNENIKTLEGEKCCGVEKNLNNLTSEIKDEKDIRNTKNKSQKTLENITTNEIIANTEAFSNLESLLPNENTTSNISNITEDKVEENEIKNRVKNSNTLKLIDGSDIPNKQTDETAKGTNNKKSEEHIADENKVEQLKTDHQGISDTEPKEKESLATPEIFKIESDVTQEETQPKENLVNASISYHLTKADLENPECIVNKSNGIIPHKETPIYLDKESLQNIKTDEESLEGKNYQLQQKESLNGHLDDKTVLKNETIVKGSESKDIENLTLSKKVKTREINKNYENNDKVPVGTCKTSNEEGKLINKKQEIKQENVTISPEENINIVQGKSEMGSNLEILPSHNGTPNLLDQDIVVNQNVNVIKNRENENDENNDKVPVGTSKTSNEEGELINKKQEIKQENATISPEEIINIVQEKSKNENNLENLPPHNGTPNLLDQDIVVNQNVNVIKNKEEDISKNPNFDLQDNAADAKESLWQHESPKEIPNSLKKETKNVESIKGNILGNTQVNLPNEKTGMKKELHSKEQSSLEDLMIVENVATQQKQNENEKQVCHDSILENNFETSDATNITLSKNKSLDGLIENNTVGKNANNAVDDSHQIKNHSENTPNFKEKENIKQHMDDADQKISIKPKLNLINELNTKENDLQKESILNEYVGHSNTKNEKITTSLDEKQNGNVSNQKPDFYRSDTVVEPQAVKKEILYLGDEKVETENKISKILHDEIELLNKDNNNNSHDIEETDLEKEVRSAVNAILNNNKEKIPLVESEIKEAIKTIMENNIDANACLHEALENKCSSANEKVCNEEEKLLQKSLKDKDTLEKCTHDLSNNTSSPLAEDAFTLNKEDSTNTVENTIKHKNTNEVDLTTTVLPNKEDSKYISTTETITDDVSSVDSMDSVITVVPNVKDNALDKSNTITKDHIPVLNKTMSYDITKDTASKETTNQHLLKKSLSADALKEHVDLIDQVQNTILDRISGKPAETGSKFDIDQLRKELEEAASLYKNEDDSSLATHDDELLEYLNDFEPEDSAPYDSKIIRTPIRELPDIEEESDSKDDDVEPAQKSENCTDTKKSVFCGTSANMSPGSTKIIDNKPLEEHIDTVKLESLKSGHNEIVINNDNIQINGKESNTTDRKMETESINKLLHTSELHDSVVIPMSSIPINKSPEQLQHTSEFHDTLVVPLPSGSDVKITNEAMLASEASSVEAKKAESVDSGNQTAYQQAPAGAAVVTSQQSSQDGVEAQAPLRDTSPTKPTSAELFTHQSPQTPRFVERDMESENNNNKRNNAISNVAATGKNMEVQAATKIQAGFRGYQVRKQLKTKNPVPDKPSLEKQPRRKSSGRKSLKDGDLAEKSAVKIQAGVRGFLVRRRQKKQINSSASA